MHNHVSAVDAVVVFAYVIIGAVIWRTVAAHNAESPLGQAMAYIL
jgi:hypothetical protein